MNVQQLPGPRDADGVFRQLNGRPIFWTRGETTHSCAGADVHPHAGIRLIWTECLIDVPAGQAFLPGDADRVTCVACQRALGMYDEDADEERANNGQFGVGA